MYLKINKIIKNFIKIFPCHMVQNMILSDKYVF